MTIGSASEMTNNETPVNNNIPITTESAIEQSATFAEIIDPPYETEYSKLSKAGLLVNKLAEIKNAFIDEVSRHPNVVFPRDVYYRTKEVVKTIPEDYKDRERRASTLGWLALTGGSQTLDRMAVSLVLVPEIATKVLENTENGLYTGVAAGLAYGAWVGGVGEVLRQTLKRHPKTMDKAQEKFPDLIDVFTDGLPGLSDVDSEGRPFESNDTQGLIALLRNKLGVHARRGATGLQIGSSAFVTTAMANGYSDKEAAKVNLKVAADSGVSAFFIGWGAGSLIVEAINNGDAERAERILDIVGNNQLWYAVAAGAVALQFALTRHEKNKQSSKADIEI